MKTLEPARLHAVVERLREGLHPVAIYLHGSHAYGTPHQDSDVDVLVVVESSDKPPYERAADASRLLRGLGMPVEVQVVTREEFARQSKWSSSIEREVKQRGVTLYAAR